MAWVSSGWRRGDGSPGVAPGHAGAISRHRVQSAPRRLFVAIVVTVLAVSGCAHRASVPVSTSIKYDQDYDQERKKIDKLEILADSCLLKDVAIGDDYFMVEESVTAAKAMAQVSALYLAANKGLQASETIVPSACGWKNEGLIVGASSKDEGDFSKISVPIYISTEVESDTEYKSALLYAMRAVLNTFDRQTRPAFSSDYDKQKIVDSLHLISDHFDRRYILFVLADGAKVSSGKKFAQGLASGFLSQILTLGTVVITSFDVSYVRDFVALVDAQEGRILWSNSLIWKGRDPTNRGSFDRNWANDNYYHLFANAPAK